MQKKTVLGKGLNALIPPSEAPEKTPAGVRLCSVSKIHPNPDQPRKRFEESTLAALADTIREKGILQPLLIRKVGSYYELIAGERRLRAAKMAGLEHVPVMIRDGGEADSLELSMLENIQRENLNPIEEAKAYKEMLERLDITQEDLASRMGKDRSSVANLVRLLQLPSEIREDLETGALSAGHARALLGLDQEVLQLKVRAHIKENGLSVRETERYVHQYKEGKQRRSSQPLPQDPDMRRIQDDLCRHFGAMVKIRDGKKGGKIQIQYSSFDDLNRICSLLLAE